MKKPFSTVATMIAVVAPALAQQQTSVKVDDKDYTVTEFPGRSMHMVQLAGPEGAAMVSVQNGKITAYISPPGGGGKQDLINKVWNAYQDQKKGNAVANSNAAPAGGTNPDDPNAAARAEMMAKANAVIAAAGNLSRANPLAPANLSVEFPAGGGAIVHGTKHGDVTFLAADGADVRVVSQLYRAPRGLMQPDTKVAIHRVRRRAI
jgi:hypothetical protein